MKEREPRKEELYTAYCTVCDWEIDGGLTKTSASLVSTGHTYLTQHQTLIQGEGHCDPEPPMPIDVITERGVGDDERME